MNLAILEASFRGELPFRNNLALKLIFVVHIYSDKPSLIILIDFILVYFPRLVVPLAGVLSGLVDFTASLIVLFVALLLYQMPLRIEMLTIPLFLLIAVIMALAVGLWLATLSVKYRDVNFAVAFLLQALMYLSPVIYPISIVPEPLRFVYQLNPMTGVIQGFRWALLGDLPPDWGIFMLSVLIAIVGMVCGAYIFRRTERTIVDLL